MTTRTAPALPKSTDTLCPCGQQYYRLAKVAELFDVSEKTLRRMITNRQLKAKRIGGSIRIPHDELAKVVREY